MEGCLFCGIVGGRIDASVVYRDQLVTAFRDINPQAPTHILIVTNEHVHPFSSIGMDQAELVTRLLTTANQLASQEGIDSDGYRLVINSGPNAGQSVDHLHLHLLGGRVFGWPPG